MSAVLCGCYIIADGSRGLGMIAGIVTFPIIISLSDHTACVCGIARIIFSPGDTVRPNSGGTIPILPRPRRSCRHQIMSQILGRAMHGIQMRRPLTQIFFGVVEDLARLVEVFEWGADVPRHDRGVVQQVKETAAVPGKEDLFFGTLNCGGKVQIICLLEFLPCLQGKVDVSGE